MSIYSDQIKDAVPMTEAAPFYGFHVNSAGFCSCPFHGEKTASLKVYPGRRGWHCFGCHKGGDVIDFVRELFGLPFVDAEKRLNDDFRLGLPLDGNGYRADAEAIKARQKAIQTREVKHRRLLKAYDEALERFAKADRLIRDSLEKPPWLWTKADEEAIKNIERYSYEMQEALTKLCIYEQSHECRGQKRGDTLGT